MLCLKTSIRKISLIVVNANLEKSEKIFRGVLIVKIGTLMGARPLACHTVLKLGGANGAKMVQCCA